MSSRSRRCTLRSAIMRTMGKSNVKIVAKSSFTSVSVDNSRPINVVKAAKPAPMAVPLGMTDRTHRYNAQLTFNLNGSISCVPVKRQQPHLHIATLFGHPGTNQSGTR
jgi:hypothetical protein